MKAMWILAALTVASLAVGCGGKACPELTEKACEMAPGSVACEAAGRLTANDECAGYLKDVAKYVELKNLKVTEPGVQPPAPAPVAQPAAEAPAEPVAEPVAEPAAEPPAAEAPAPAEAPAAN